MGDPADRPGVPPSFGGKKIPELMHGLGKGMKSFRKGMNEVEDEIKEATKEFDSITKETEEKK